MDLHLSSEQRVDLAQQFGDMIAFEWDGAARRFQGGSRFRELLGLPDDVPLTLRRVLNALHPEDRARRRLQLSTLEELVGSAP